MTSNTRLFRHVPLAILVTLLAACGSSVGNKSSTPSSSSSSSSGSTKPVPIVNAVKIKVTGIDGTLELINGSDTLVVKSNGDTQFARTVEVGVSYNVQITKQPENQICSVKNGRKVMVASNVALVEIACSNGFGVSLDIAKPKDFGLKNLQVVSNYQRLGGANDPALTLDSTIKTRQNSFVALKHVSEEKTYFLSYINSDGQRRIKLDADSTALALLVMDPIVTDALTSHKLTVTNLFDLIAPINAQNTRQLDGDLKKLADEIARQADKNVDLFSAQSNIGALLEKVLTSVIDKIANQTMASVPSVQPAPVADLGVDFTIQNKSPTKVALTINNQRQRSLAVTGLTDLATPSIVDANSAITLEQTIEAGKFYKLNLVLSGPGKLGTLNASNSGFKSAFSRSSLADYFMPNIAYFSGSQSLAASLPMDCLNEDNLADLTDVASAAWSSVQAPLEQDLYYKAYHTMADKYRAYWYESAHMDELLTCSSLGLAGLTVNEKQIAKAHLTSLFTGLNKLRDPNSVKEDLFRTEKQSALASAIFSSAAQGAWSISNAFTLDIKAPNSFDDEAESQFSARCLDEAKKEVACTLSWTFENNEFSGNSVKYQFKSAGSQVVNVVATNSSGAQVSQTIAISVQRKSAGISMALKDSTVALDTKKPLDFGAVFVGTRLPQTLVIKNTGNLPLTISAITLESPGFTTSLKETTVNVGAELAFAVEFAPSEERAYTGALSFQTNDKSAALVQLSLTGLGTPAVAAGKYEIIDNSVSREEIVAVTNETAISGDENFSQVDLFGQSTGVFPRISLKLNKFTGPGSYSLDDIDVDDDGIPETCLALYSAAKDFTQQYCTGITSGGTYSGTLVVTDISADMYKLDYDFSAVNCTQSTGGAICSKKVIQLRGTTNVSKAVLLPQEELAP